MTRHILSVRLNRRAIGAVVLADEALTMTDGRHLTSARDRAVPAAVRYIDRLLAQSGAGSVVVDAPAPVAGTTTKLLLDGIVSLLSSRGIEPLLITKPDILTAYGLLSVRTRHEVREIVSGFWPELARIPGRVKPYAADAAAAALYAETRLALSPTPT